MWGLWSRCQCRLKDLLKWECICSVKEVSDGAKNRLGAVETSCEHIIHNVSRFKLICQTTEQNYHSFGAVVLTTWQI